MHHAVTKDDRVFQPWKEVKKKPNGRHLFRTKNRWGTFVYTDTYLTKQKIKIRIRNFLSYIQFYYIPQTVSSFGALMHGPSTQHRWVKQNKQACIQLEAYISSFFLLEEVSLVIKQYTLTINLSRFLLLLGSHVEIFFIFSIKSRLQPSLGNGIGLIFCPVCKSA